MPYVAYGTLVLLLLLQKSIPTFVGGCAFCLNITVYPSLHHLVIHLMFWSQMLACTTGAGGHFHVAFPPAILDDNNYNIDIKELLAIIAALRLWGPQLTGRHLLIRSDNNAVLAINNRRSHSLLIQQCLRVIWFLCASFDLDIQAEHIPGFINEIADLLSRWYQDPQAEEKFYALPDADPQLCFLTSDLLRTGSYLC